MNATEKRQLINELASEFWPAVLVARFSDSLGDRTFLYVDFIKPYGSTDSAEVELRRHLLKKLETLLGEAHDDDFILSYGYAEGLSTDVDLSLSDLTRDDLVDMILDELSEDYIREAFASQRVRFFDFTMSTSADWFMRPAP